MSKAKGTVEITNSDIHSPETVHIGAPLLSKCRIPAPRSVTLRYGAHQSEIHVLPMKGKKKTMRVHQTLAGRLGLLPGTTLNIRYRKTENELKIGPLIGILVNRVQPDNEQKPFGEITDFCCELSESCRLQGGVLYIFTPEDMDTNRSMIGGWIYDKRWIKVEQPIPDVIHNRLTSRQLENSSEVRNFLEYAKVKCFTQTFNEKYLNKLEVFRALKNAPHASKYLPESHELSANRLRLMCEKYRTVFLKPNTGSSGRGIIRIEHSHPIGYTCYFTCASGTRKRNFTSFQAMASALRKKIKGRLYQIQQGLNLIQISGRPVDFRALVQKDAKGEWKITTLAARVAGPGQFVSNLAKGGTLFPAIQAIEKSNLTVQNSALAYAGLRRAALEISREIETFIPGLFGELGIDLALDGSGKIWLLEVNSKPSKTQIPQIAGKIRPSAKRLITYAKYLAGF